MEKNTDLPSAEVRVVIFARSISGSAVDSRGQELVARRMARRHGWVVVGPAVRTEYDDAVELASRSGAEFLLIAQSNCLDGEHEPFVARVRNVLAFAAAWSAAKAAHR